MTPRDDVMLNAAHHRFELTVDGLLANLTYDRTDDTLVLLHTEVPAALGGRGLGGTLVEAAVDFAANTGLGVDARCEFARSWLDRHPEVARRVRIALDQE